MLLKRKGIWIAAAIILVVFMYGWAEWTNMKEIIFPEIAALTIGTWVFTKPDWNRSYFLLWFSPTIAAIIVVGLQNLTSMNINLLILTSYFLTVTMLYLLKSQVTPSIAAAILPILLRIDSWYYVISVCFFTGTIAIVKKLFERQQLETPAISENNYDFKNRSYWLRKNEIIHWLFVGTVLCGVSLLATSTELLFITAPPLIVTLVEFTKANSPLQKNPYRLVLIMFLSSVAGVIYMTFFHGIFHLQLWFVAIFSVVSIMILLEKLKLLVPPAAAISLLPTIIDIPNLWLYPIQIFIGTSLFLLVGSLYNKWSFAVAQEETPGQFRLFP